MLDPQQRILLELAAEVGLLMGLGKAWVQHESLPVFEYVCCNLSLLHCKLIVLVDGWVWGCYKAMAYCTSKALFCEIFCYKATTYCTSKALFCEICSATKKLAFVVTHPADHHVPFFWSPRPPREANAKLWSVCGHQHTGLCRD